MENNLINSKFNALNITWVVKNQQPDLSTLFYALCLIFFFDRAFFSQGNSYCLKMFSSTLLLEDNWRFTWVEDRPGQCRHQGPTFCKLTLDDNTQPYNILVYRSSTHLKGKVTSCSAGNTRDVGVMATHPQIEMT